MHICGGGAWRRAAQRGRLQVPDPAAQAHTHLYALKTRQPVAADVQHTQRRTGARHTHADPAMQPSSPRCRGRAGAAASASTAGPDHATQAQQ